MNALINRATTDLEGFLSVHLPTLAGDWWQKHVIDCLSFQQQMSFINHFGAMLSSDLTA